MKLNTSVSSFRILVVEDEIFQRRMISRILRSQGVPRISECDSGSAAVSLLQTQRVNLVFSDIDMPGLNGLEFLRQIRTGQTPARRDMPFVILTSHSNTEVLNAAIALDVNSFIVKPFTARLILDKISRISKERMTLRPESAYASVPTDLSSLRRTRFSANASEQTAVAAASQMEIPLTEVRVGMRLARDLTAVDGTVVLNAGTILTETIINLLSDLASLVGGGVAIVREPRSEVGRRITPEKN